VDVVVDGTGKMSGFTGKMSGFTGKMSGYGGLGAA
jgi:hypothetical protein